MPPQDLERSVADYSSRIANRVISSRRSPRVRDYPAAVVTCRMNNGNRKIYSEKSGRSRPGMFEPVLENALNQLGGVGQHSGNGCPNTIGSCAEPRAANRLIRNNNHVGLNQILFSTALRPRTGQVVPYCDNCRATFPNL